MPIPVRFAAVRTAPVSTGDLGRLRAGGSSHKGREWLIPKDCKGQGCAGNIAFGWGSKNDKEIPVRDCSQTIYCSLLPFSNHFWTQGIPRFQKGTKTPQGHRIPRIEVALVGKWYNFEVHTVWVHLSYLRLKSACLCSVGKCKAWVVPFFNETVALKCQVTSDDINRKERKGS